MAVELAGISKISRGFGKPLFSNIDTELQELEAVLEADKHILGWEEPPETQFFKDPFKTPREHKIGVEEPPRTYPLPSSWLNLGISVLTKIEKQNRRLVLLVSLLCALLVLFLLGFAFFAIQYYTGGQVSLQGAAKEKMVVLSAEKVPLSAATKTEPPPTSPAGKEAETSTFNYVGSITSNKYHYPDCKWARTIRAHKLRGFGSVKEARKAGYIPCPTCRPPTADDQEAKSARR